MLTIHEKRDMIGYYVENIIAYFSFFCIFSSPVRITESYSDTPGVSVRVSVKMLKFLVQVFSFLMFLSTTLFFTDYNIQIHILL